RRRSCGRRDVRRALPRRVGPGDEPRPSPGPGDAGLRGRLGQGLEPRRGELQRPAEHRRGPHRLRLGCPGLVHLGPGVPGGRERVKERGWSMTRWGVVIDTARCVGCGACTIACKTENATPADTWYAPVIEYEVGEY